MDNYPSFSIISMNTTKPDLWQGIFTTMLTIKCAACKAKLFKYDKIGSGQVLRCYKSRIVRVYTVKEVDEILSCICGKKIADDKGGFYRMIPKSFTYTGTKR